jgi:hypothetical protein
MGKDAARIRADLRGLRVGVNPGTERLWRAALSGCGLCWRLMIQFAKLVGYRIANGGGEDLLRIQVSSDPEIQRNLDDLSELLSKYWSQYPVWPKEPPPFLREIWSRLSDLLGYEFRTVGGKTRLLFR